MMYSVGYTVLHCLVMPTMLHFADVQESHDLCLEKFGMMANSGKIWDVLVKY